MTIFDPLESGGAVIGGTAPVTVVNGGGQVAADIVVEWDLDNDGDFNQSVENITSFVMAAESLTGRDWPSQLTGKAGPGQLRLTLLNDDDRFSYFNLASPLKQAPFSLETGRKIRVRTTTAANPDPIRYAKDRFLGSGALGTDELGKVWTNITDMGFILPFVRQQDSSGDTLCVPQTKSSAGATRAVVDIGDDDCFIQAKLKFLDTGNWASIMYRFQDLSNYGFLQLTEENLILGKVVANVVTTTQSIAIQRHPDTTWGLLVQGSTATAYLEGVPVFSNTAHSDTDTNVGIACFWANQRPPSFHEFYVWDRVFTITEGILWTGDVSRITPSVELGPHKVAEVEAEGWLSKLAEQEVTPPISVGPAPGVPDIGPGVTAGLMVGHVLSSAQQLHPPGELDAGDLTLGAVGLPRGKALDLARTFEEAELGFLHECAEGYICFHSRSARVGASVMAGFSDVPGAQFGYQTIEMLDWRGEITNRVDAALSPKIPRIIFGNTFSATTAASSTNHIDITMPTSGNGAVEGMLVLVVVASTVRTPGVNWLTPPDWKSYRDGKDSSNKLRIYAKVIRTEDFGDSVRLYADAGAGGAWHATLKLIGDWHGSLDDGLVVAEPHGYGEPSTPGILAARAGKNDPPPVFPDWGPAPSLFFVHMGGLKSTGGGDVGAANSDHIPNGYGFAAATLVNGSGSNLFDVGHIHAARNGCAEVEDPSSFPTPAAVNLDGFDNVETTTIAVRGFAGDPPEAQGGQVVRVDDAASQASHNSIRTHTNAAHLFATTADAEAYGEGILVMFGNSRPIPAITFPATLNAATRAQAFRRRVGDKINLVANDDTGMGIDGDFFIESIGHRWTDAGKVWEVTWQLSPA